MTTELTHILLKRGNTAQSLAYTGPLGEVTVDTDLHSLRVHDGDTPGGNLVSSGTGPANTGNWSFLNNAIHNLAGGQINNGDQTHGYTAGIILPVNGAASSIVLNNTYGNVILQSGANSDVTASWTFGSDGKLTLPGTIGSISSEIGTDLIISNQGTGATLSWSDGAFVPNTTPISSITVSDLGATIDVTTDGWNTVKTWSFGTDGTLTLPDSATLAVGSGAEIDALTLVYTDYRDQLDLVFANANYTGDGYPASFESYNLLVASADPAIQPSWRVLAKNAEDAYVAMVTAQQAISFNIDIYGRQWTFTSDRSNILNSLLIPENTTISGPDSIELRADGDANKKALINLDAANNRVSILTTNLGWVFSNNGILSLPTVGKIGNGPANWTFSEGGTLTVPSPQSNPFLLTFAATNYFSTIPKPTLALTSGPWTVEGQYVYAANGESQLTLGAIGPNLVNPGYESGDTFTFEVYGADQLVNHGIVGYTLTITLTSVVQAGPAGWTATATESAAPEYPSTILTSGAIKLTSNLDTNWIFGTGGALTLPGTVAFPDATIQSTAWTGSSSTLTDGVFTIDSFQVSTQIETWTAGATNMSPTDSISFFGHSSKLFDTSWTMSGSGITGQSAITAIDPIMSGMSITGYTVTIAQTISTGLVTGDYVFSNPPSTQGVNITSDLSTWKFGTDGNLTLPHGSTITDTASAPGWNNGQAVEIKPGGGSNVNQLLKIYPTVPSPDGNHIHITSGDLSVTDLFLGNDDQFVQIATDGKVCIGTSTSHIWTFGADGHVTFPDGSIQTTAFTGLADNNIWIETFASDAPSIDFVQSATSVEYDLAGNIIALFSHVVPSNSNETYTSVAKLLPTGEVLWRVRFGSNLNTDGWGVAYDVVYNYIYIAGSTSGPGIYKFATLTKLSSLDGSLVWSKTYDFEADSQSSVVDVGQAGDPVMVGYAFNGTDNYIVTTRINRTDGSVVWCNTLNGQGYDQAYGMAVGPDSEVVTIGYVDKLLPTDSVATAVTEPTSNVNWTTPHTNALTNGVNFDIDISAGVPTISINNDDTGGRVVGDTFATILGSTFGGQDGVDDMIVKVDTLAVNDDTDRMVVIKYASDGVIAWQKAVQFEVGYNCTGADADIDTNGNIYVCGQYSYDTGSGTDSAMNLLKFDSAGVKQWSRRVVGNCETFATSVVMGDDGYLYLSGVTGNNNTSDFIWVVAKYDTDGVVVWQRLIDNTTTWTFGGGFWFSSNGGGSNIAVRNGYIVLAGAFADPFINPQATAVVLQLDTDATPFSVGDWDIKGATFSGVLNNTASDITVVDAGKVIGTVGPSVGVLTSSADFSNFLTVTRYSLAGGSSSSIDNSAYSVSVGSNGVVTMATSRGSLEFGALPEPGAQSHFHIMKASGDTADLFLGDDFNYVLQRGPAYGQAPGYGVEIGANDNNGGSQHSWRFGTDGTTFFPDGTNFGNINGSGTIGFAANVGSSFTIGTIGGSWEFGADGEFTIPTGGHLGATKGGTMLDGGNGYDTSLTTFYASGNYAACVTGFAADGRLIITTYNDGGDNPSKQWIFGTDSTTTLPANSSIITSNTALKIATSPTITYTFDQAYWASVDGDVLRVVTPSGNAQYFACTVTANQNGTYTVAVTGAGNSFVPGNWFKIPGNELGGATPANDIQITVATVDGAGVILTVDPTGTAVSKQWQFGTDGTTTLPGAITLVVAGTVAKTGAINVGTNKVATVSIEPTYDATWVNSYSVSNGGFSCDIAFPSAGNPVFGNIVDSVGNRTVGDTLATVLGSALGITGVDGVNDMVIKVATLTDTIATALDLTKSINKLTDGSYTLANGVEGQIMYLVRQNGSTAANIFVGVGSGRLDGTVYSEQYVIPFQIPFTDMVTIIFTDGAWQSSTLGLVT